MNTGHVNTTGKQDNSPSLEGITFDNVFEKLDSKDSRDGALLCIDVWASALFQTDELKLLSEENLISLLKRDSLQADEYTIFEGLVNWGRHHLLESNIVPTPEKLIEQLNQTLPLIRFPLMTVAEAAKVAAINVLTTTQMLDLFKFAALDATDRKVKLYESIANFNITPRASLAVPASWRWVCSQCQTRVVSSRTLCSTCNAERDTKINFVPPQNDDEEVNVIQEPHALDVEEREDEPLDTPSLWACPGCTVENEMGVPLCIVCETPNPHVFGEDGKISNATVHVQHQPQLTAGPGMWLCKLCTCENLLSTMRCVACQALQQVDTSGSGMESKDQQYASSSSSFLWQRKAHTIGGADSSSFQVSLRDPVSGTIQVPLMDGIGWLRLPHIGIYGDPYEISHPMFLCDLPVESAAESLLTFSPAALKAFLKKPPLEETYMTQTSELLEAEEGEDEEVEVPEPLEDSAQDDEDIFVAAGAAAAGSAVSGYAHAAAALAAATSAAAASGALYDEVDEPESTTAPISNLQPPASEPMDEDNEAEITDYNDVKMCAEYKNEESRVVVMIHDILDQSNKTVPDPLNVLLHPWVFGHKGFGFESNESTKVHVGIYGASGLLDQLKLDLQYHNENDCSPIPHGRGGFRVAHMHGAHFSPDNCHIHLDMKAAVHSFMIIAQTEHMRVCSYHVIPGSMELHHELKSIVKNSQYLEQVLETLLLKSTQDDAIVGLAEVQEKLGVLLGPYLSP